MKSVGLFFLISTVLCVAIIAPVSAYQVYIDCPSEIYVGQTLKVTGNSSFPSGTSFDLVLYEASYTSTEIDRRTITLQDSNDKTFAIAFSTKGLKGGLYKIEFQSTSTLEDRVSSDSTTQKLIHVLDRSDEITITAPITQTLNDALRVEGSIKNLGNEGIKIEVRGPDGPAFGPTWVETKRDIKTGDGEFTKKVSVTVAGEYDVHFTDSKGYIGVETITVVAPTTRPATTVTTQPPTTVATPLPITTVPPTPTPTKSPASPLVPLVSLGVFGVIAVLLERRRMN